MMLCGTPSRFTSCESSRVCKSSRHVQPLGKGAGRTAAVQRAGSVRGRTSEPSAKKYCQLAEQEKPFTLLLEPGKAAMGQSQ